MLAYLVRRLLLMVPTLVGITFVVVAIMLVAPGEPTAEEEVGPGTTVTQAGHARGLLEAKKEMGFFDEQGEKLAPWTAWWNWVSRAARLDFGRSFKYHRPVVELLAERLPVTLLLNCISLLLIFLLSIPAGIFSATHQGTVRDGALSTVLFLLYSMPSWWVATMLVVCFGSVTLFDVFPVVGLHSDGYERFTLFEYLADTFMHVVLPIACLTYGGLATVSRYMRAGMLEVVRQDYIRTARAKGLDEHRVIYRHALRNALIPMVTLAGTLLPAMIGGSIIIEEIFSIDGMGRLGFEAIASRDYLVVMANTLVAAVLTLVGILLADILYCVVDPRISLD